MKWKKDPAFGKECYSSTLNGPFGLGIKAWVYRLPDECWHLSINGCACVVSHEPIEDATNAKEAARYAKDRLSGIVSQWLEEIG